MSARPGWVAARTANIARKQAEADRLERMIRRGGWNRTTYWEFVAQWRLKNEVIAGWRTELEKEMTY